MSRRILLIEPDDAGRHLMQRVLAADGLRVDAVRALAEAAPATATAATLDLAVVDELSGGGLLEDVRSLRRRAPRLPIVLTGTLLSPPVLIQALRMGVADALPKPFAPSELRGAIARTLDRSAAGRTLGLEFAAAVTTAREAIGRGKLVDAKSALAGARAASSFDSEVMALDALVAELEGADADADRGYRAALALRHEEDTPSPHPGEGLARLEAYSAANPASGLPASFVGAPAWFVGDPRTLVDSPPPAAIGQRPHVLVMVVGLSPDAGAVFFRVAAARAFVLILATQAAEAVARALTPLHLGPLLGNAAADADLDLERVSRLRAPPEAGRAVER